ATEQRREGSQDRDARQPLVAGDSRAETEQRRDAGQAPQPEVDGHLGRPDRLLQDRPAVVALLAHRRADPSASATPATTTPAAIAAAPHMPLSRLVGTTGRSGSPYAWGWSRSRKSEPAPPT